MLSNGECDLHPQERLIVDKILHLDEIQTFEYGILDRVASRILWKSLFLYFFFSWSAVKYSWSPRIFPISMSMSSSLFDDILKD